MATLWKSNIQNNKEAIMAKEIRANKFVLEDDNGKSRVSLSVVKDSVSLSLQNEKGEKVAAMGISNEGIV